MTPRTLDDRAAKFQPVREFLLKSPQIDEVRVNVGMPMEFDPRAGERPKPDGVEFTIPDDDDLNVLARISKACDFFGMEVRKPDFKQPGFSYENHRGETVAYNDDVDYDALVRLVPKREVR